MRKQETVNTFSEGLMLDLNPLSMPNNTLANCLNGTLLTYNGNENMLLNDMGNARVETAMLPSGYIPLGSTSFGGIIYIVSYNPIAKKYQIGSFPSPERNFSKDELGDSSNTTIKLKDFTDTEQWESDNEKFGSLGNKITNYVLKVNLLTTNIYPGDKYRVFSELIEPKYISAWDQANDDQDPNLYPKYLKLDIVSTLENGRTINLTDQSVWVRPNDESKDPPFYIYPENISSDTEKSLDEYRSLIMSNYDVYQSKLSGLLGILAKLEVPTLFSVGYEVMTTTESGVKNILFYFLLNWSNDNEGEQHKNRVNPNGILYAVESKNKELVSENVSLLLELFEEKEKEKEKEKVVPDAFNDVDYKTIVAPENYWTTGYETYLKKGKNKFGPAKRHNDGTDFQYLMKGPLIRKKADAYYMVKGEEEIAVNSDIKMEVTPTMPFGTLTFLKRTLEIDLNKLLTGEINLLHYLYYVDSDEISIDFFLEAYPELGHRIEGIDLDFYPLYEYVNDHKELLKQETYEKSYNQDGLRLNGTEDGFHKDCNGTSGLLNVRFQRKNLKYENRVYLVRFTVKYTNGHKIFYRLFFNSGIFNSAYNTNTDFKDLYLQEKDKEYGIRPKIQFENEGNIVGTLTSSSGDEVEEYSKIRTTEDIEKIYSIKDSMSGNYKITTSLGKELEVNLSLGAVTLSDTDIKNQNKNVQVKTGKVSIATKDKELTFDHTYEVTIPYTLSYTLAVTLDEYALVPLQACNSGVELLHFSEEAKGGHFLCFINNSSHDTPEALVSIPDNSGGLSYSLDDLTRKLSNIFLAENGDYLNVKFGIGAMKDNDCGYGIVNTSAYRSDAWKLWGKTLNAVILMTCLKINGLVMLIHKGTSGERGSGEPVNDGKLGFNDRTSIDRRIIQNSSKFSKTGIKKLLYYVDAVDYPKNPTIQVDYILLAKTELNGLMLNEANVTVPKEGGVKNLILKDLDESILHITSNTIINNLDEVKEWYMLESPYGWNLEKNTLIKAEEVQNIYDSNGKVNPHVGIVNNNIYLKSSPNRIDWYFGWEHLLEGNAGSISISLDDLKKLSELWYQIGSTYGV